MRPAVTSLGRFWPMDTKRLSTPALELDHRPSYFYQYVDAYFATITEPTSVNVFLNNLI